MERTTYQTHFEQIIAGLNPTQRRAVEQTEGPVLAIAGPGTGKTHMLTARIGQILLHTDAQAQNVLCLTFTDAAVNAMRQRLLQFIGPEAHRVHLYTFHSFCNKVIQENLEVFGRHDLEPLSDLERIEVIRSIIDHLDVEHPLRLGRRDPYYYERHLASLFQLMKGERWAPNYLESHIDVFLESLPDRPEYHYQRNAGAFKKGDLKDAQLKKTQMRMERLRSAVRLFNDYEDALEQRQRYDYDDMVLWVLEAFEEDEHLLRTYQEQYLYFLVDEFQDTNGSQSAIVEHLVSYWGEQPNLFIVGDDDQSIYEFQGARMKNMTDFYEKYQKHALLVVLKDNYRSSQAILDVARQSIDQNELRIINQLKELGLDKTLLGVNPHYAHLAVPVQIVAYPNQLQEEIALVQQLEQLQEQGIPLHEVAILYAKHKQAETLIDLLEKRQIPYQSKRRINILELPLLYNLRKLMLYIVQEYQQPESGESIFFEFLYYDFLGISAHDAALLTAYMARCTKVALAKRAYEAIPLWRATLRNRTLLDTLGLEHPERLTDLIAFLDESIHQYKDQRLPKFIEFIINRSGLIRYVTQHPRKLWLTQVVGTLFEFVRRESAKNPRLDLAGLLALLDQMQANHLGMGLFQVEQSDNGVHLITAHSAKGLEFEYVFIINAIKDYWEPNSRSGRSFLFPDTLVYSNETDALEAARRLFYVAMTRAKRFLQISHFQLNNKNKPQTRSLFVDELVEGTQLPLIIEERTASQPTQWQLHLLTQAPDTPTVPLLPTDAIRDLLQGFRLSISAMNSYLECPLSFYYEYILRVPTVSSVEAAYGTAIHNALHRLFVSAMKEEPVTVPPVERFLELFEYEMNKQRYFLPIKAFRERLDLGKRHLPHYYQARLSGWMRQLQRSTVWTEKPFRNVELDGVPVTGTIDKLVFQATDGSKHLHLVDYKTGRLKDKRLQGPTKSQPHGGIYWRQLLFYKLLVEQANVLPYLVKTATIDYLTPTDEGEFPSVSLTFEPEEVAIVREMVIEVYQRIQYHEFGVGCGKPSCKWCNFAQNNILPNDFTNLNIEALDDRQ